MRHHPIAQHPRKPRATGKLDIFVIRVKQLAACCPGSSFRHRDRIYQGLPPAKARRHAIGL